MFDIEAQRLVTERLSLNSRMERPELVGQKICAAPLAIVRRSLLTAGSRTKILNVGPVGGGASNGPVGRATLRPSMGRLSGWPSKTPLKIGGAKKSCALRTSYG